MSFVDYLANGSIRLSGRRCTFLIRRLAPSAILTSIAGRDVGEFGDYALQAIEAEFVRFQKPVMWFVDASRALNAKNFVFEQWTAWFRANQSRLGGVHVLTGNDPMQLTVSIARHISGIEDRMYLHANASTFVEAVRRTVKDFSGLEEDARFSEEPIQLERTPGPGGTVQLRGPKCQYRIEPMSNGIVLTSISGEDSGELGAAPIDEVQAAINRAGKSAGWFVDARAIHGRLSKRVSEDWTAWLMSHEDQLRQVAVLSPSTAYPLILSIARLRLRSPHLMRVYREQADFEAALRASVPGFQGLAAAACAE